MKCDVLVVDNDPSLLRLIVLGLKAVPCLRPVGAVTLGEALAVLDSDPPDLVITDLRLDGESGLDLISELERRGSRAPVVVITGYRDAYRDRLARYPDLIVLDKPMTIAEMQRRVEETLAGRWQSGEHARELVDSLRLAALAGGSLKFEVELASGGQGRLEVVDGEPWNAYAGESEGEDALAMVFGAGSRPLGLSRMHEPPPGRQLLSTALLRDLRRAGETPARAAEPLFALRVQLDDAANRACRNIQEDVEADSCVLVDVTTATLVGVSPVSSHRPDLLTAGGAGFLALFHRALEQTEGEETAPEGALDEVYLASRKKLRFFKQVPGKALVIALLTGRTIRQGVAWMALRRGLPFFQELVSAGGGPETQGDEPAAPIRRQLDDSASHACRQVAESIAGVRGCGLLDPGTSTLVGLSGTSDFLDEVTVRAADLFRTSARAHGGPPGDPLDEVFVSSGATFHFLKRVPGNDWLLAVTTDTTTRAAVTWMAIHDALPELASLSA